MVKEAFTELRILPFINGNRTLTNDSLVEAVTLNENLGSYGFTLRPNDLIKLAKSESLDSIFSTFKSCLDTVDAKPMYPDFPNQVMALDEATFRFHQMVHYFSTYGIESLFGVKVSKGWLPDVTDTEKIEEDDTLLNAKVIELVDEDVFREEILMRILSKRDRMTSKELSLVKEVIKDVHPGFFTTFSIPFKQNLLVIFEILMKDENRKDNLKILWSICQHTGDVFKCLDYYLVQRNFHLTTSEKRTSVKLLEMFPVVDFKFNLILSNKKAERTLLVLQYLDYNQYSRSVEHSLAVAALRGGELQSWEGKAKWLIGNSQDQERVLNFLEQRPGILLRWTAWLLRLGFSEASLLNKLLKHASSLSLSTLNAILVKFGITDDNPALFGIVKTVLIEKMKTLNTDLRNKKVFLNDAEFDLDQSVIDPERADEGGYVRSGLSFKIPEKTNVIRFFTYWNDDERIDVDLHAVGVFTDGDYFKIGYDKSYYNGGIIMSGDLTCSDSAEYIDVELSNDEVSKVFFTINLYAGANNFSQIEKCFTGMLAVSRTGEEVALYNPKNCFFSHDLKSKESCLHYGFLDLQRKTLTIIGKKSDDIYNSVYQVSKFTLREFLNYLFEAQGVTLVDDEGQADIVLSVGKSESEKGISLIDQNFFLD